jgi:hypothetical protein
VAEPKAFTLIKTLVLLWLSFTGINRKLKKINKNLDKLERRIASIPDFDFELDSSGPLGIDEYDPRSWVDATHHEDNLSLGYGHSLRFGYYEVYAPIEKRGPTDPQ